MKEFSPVVRKLVDAGPRAMLNKGRLDVGHLSAPLQNRIPNWVYSAGTGLVTLPLAKRVVDTDAARGIAGNAAYYALNPGEANYRDIFRLAKYPATGVGARMAANYAQNVRNPLLTSPPTGKRLSPAKALARTVADPSLGKAVRTDIFKHPDTQSQVTEYIVDKARQIYPRFNEANPKHQQLVRDIVQEGLGYGADAFDAWASGEQLPDLPQTQLVDQIKNTDPWRFYEDLPESAKVKIREQAKRDGKAAAIRWLRNQYLRSRTGRKGG